ncbi:hypothetical protein H7F15_11965 [Pontibacter sp. Tf4]|uniref:hypothetical protein n=1 Tax=Pontibacter sp. Tf4 TaxID=2761620 RepID=UPI0016231F85|nr:hypothetical protein [Pontibacter sp. Tf4]MBB6611757.1 hypothetical protein [Pontibacter sp. Tf4]
MKHLKKFITHLQTFNLKVVPKKIYCPKSAGREEVKVYEITHETSYGDVSFENELKLLTETALVDILVLDDRRLPAILEQLDLLEKRFQAFWVNFHSCRFDLDFNYPPDFLFQISLPKLFPVPALQPVCTGIVIDEQFVDDLTESVRLREAFLADFIRQARRLLTPEEECGKSVQPVAGKPVLSYPHFTDGVAEKFTEVLKGYFTQADQGQLLPLFLHNQAPASPLLFHGNGKQLADAFKQLYEANLIVGCLKGEMETWIATHFAYVYRGQQKSLPPNYLGAIISSNAKPCQSPILDVRKQADGSFTIVQVLRTQKNYSSY